MNSRNRITPPPLVPGQFIPFTRQRSYYGLPGTVYREFTTKLPAASFIWSRADEIYRNLILGMLRPLPYRYRRLSTRSELRDYMSDLSSYENSWSG